MPLFKDKRRPIMLEKLSRVEEDEVLFQKFTKLQNEISIAYDTKVLAVASLGDDELTAAFAKAFAIVYGKNNSKTLIIDANLYNPCLSSMLQLEAGDELTIYEINENVGVVPMQKEIYPSTIYKSGVIHKFIEEHRDEYDHFIILVPDLRENKEISLLKDIINSELLVVRRDITKEKHIFDAAKYCKAEEIVISKVVVLK